MAGRPRKPIALKRAEGDTRQRGSNKHEQSLAAAWEARRGMPDMPKGLDYYAKQYWQTTAEGLAAEGLLATIDEGMLTATALIYGELRKAAKERDRRGLCELTQRFIHCCDRMGLNESARAKLATSPGMLPMARPKAPPIDPMMEAMLQ